MNTSPPPLKLHNTDILWELWCVVSIIGIWPRYIEPKLLQLCQHEYQVPNLPNSLEGLKVVHIGDTHFHSRSDKRFFSKVSKKINEQTPDIILFSGDFISYASIENPELIFNFFKSLKSKYGIFASLGNHDYSHYVTLERPRTLFDKLAPVWSKIYSEYLSKNKKSARITPNKPSLNQALINLLKSANVTVLNNERTVLKIANANLEIVGVGDLWAQHFDPQKAFSKSQKKLPNSLRLLLCHNPDAIDCGLDNYEFDLALSGHTHGSQVNLPLMGIHVTNSAHDKFKRGLYKIGKKQLYITRGISSHFPFRWFSRPEITLFNFRSA